MILFSFLFKFKRARLEDPQYGLVDNEGDYESTIALTNGASNLYAFRLHSSHLDLHHAGGFETEDLRLAWMAVGVASPIHV